MESVFKLIQKGVPENNSWQPFFDSLKSKTDVIVGAARNTENDSKLSLLSTTLMKTLANGGVIPEYTAGCLVLLSVQGDNLPDGCQDAYFRVCKLLFSIANKEQALVAHKEVANITNKLATLGVKYHQANKLVQTLVIAVRISSPSATCLTPTHANFLQICIAAQMYTFAVDYIRSHDIFEIDPSKTSLTTADYLRYFHYCGICFIAVKDFASALEAFTQVVTTPASALSGVVVSSVKKAKLCALILRGETYAVNNKLVPTVVSRHLGGDHPVYDDLEKAFLTSNADGLFNIVNDTGHAVLTRDGNHGLAKQAVAALTKHRIKRLTKTYITLSLQDIATAVSVHDPAVVEKLLVKMIRDGDILARIHCETSMVRFGPVEAGDKAQVSEAKAAEAVRLNATMERSIHSTLLLSEKLKDLQKEVLTSSTHILKSINVGGGGGGGNSSSRGGGGGGWGNSIGDFMMDTY